MKKTTKNLTNDKIVLKIMETLKIQHKTEKDLLIFLGLSTGTFTKWKYDNMKSYRRHLDRIAEFLDVSPAYLEGDTDDIVSVHSITPYEVRLLQLYRKMGQKERDTLINSAEFYAMATEYQRNQAKG